MRWLLAVTILVGCSKHERKGGAELPPVVATDASARAAAPAPDAAADGAAVLVGKWRAGGSVGGGATGHPAMSWMLEYEFRPDGTFKAVGYPQIEITGHWEVLAVTEMRAHLRLTGRKMKAPGSDALSDWPDLDETAERSDGGKTIKFDNKSFTREAP